ncbi:hypothetical protein JYU34_005355 [Plutella xylostella]|uniref:Uncharacterized protein n=1 Tax=Plutella xylostella TaxID=51655 RepID=A0ABQ7QWG6_PLUXY|nr:hypothetical protein JYU34_005355 [Plutella xylostella]
MCGYSDSIYIVVASGSSAEERLVASGMLMDIRSQANVPRCNSFYDMAVHRISSLDERIRLCNELRDRLAERKSIRWCGAEYESLFHPKIVQNAGEINGLAGLGRSMNEGGV